MKRRIKAGDLRKPRPVDHDRPDGRQIVRLMQRRERDIALEAVQHVFRHENGLIEFRAAMHDAMAHRYGMNVEFVAKPRARSMQRRRNMRHSFIRVGLLNQNLPFR